MQAETYGGKILRTEKGIEIKIEQGEKRCVVYLGNEPESVTGPDGLVSMEQEIPHVAFIGSLLVLELPQGELVLLPVLGHRLRIPYRFQGDERRRYLNLHCNSQADQFPAKVRHDREAAIFLAAVRGTRDYKYVVVDEGVSRAEMLRIKTAQPGAQILILKGAPLKRQARQGGQKDSLHMRATDLASAGGGSNNPVFLARVYLRKLELDRLVSLIEREQMTAEEAGFIRAFIQIMLRNESNKEELRRVHGALLALEELYRLGELVLSEKRQEFYREMERLPGRPSAQSCEGVRRLLDSRQKAAADRQDKLKEIFYWEWSFRWRKLCA